MGLKSKNLKITTLPRTCNDVVEVYISHISILVYYL
jgi:hypothetical protein